MEPGTRSDRDFSRTRFDTPSYSLYIKSADLTNFVYQEQETALFEMLTARAGITREALRKSLESSNFNHVDFIVSRVK